MAPGQAGTRQRQGSVSIANSETQITHSETDRQVSPAHLIIVAASASVRRPVVRSAVMSRDREEDRVSWPQYIHCRSHWERDAAQRTETSKLSQDW